MFIFIFFVCCILKVFIFYFWRRSNWMHRIFKFWSIEGTIIRPIEGSITRPIEGTIIRPIEGSITRTIKETITRTTNSSQSGPESNGNEGVLHTPSISRTGASPSSKLFSLPEHLFCYWWRRILTFCWGYGQYIVSPIHRASYNRV